MGFFKMTETYTVKPSIEAGDANRKFKEITLPKPAFEIPPAPKEITAAPLRVSTVSPDTILKKPMQSYGFKLVTK